MLGLVALLLPLGLMACSADRFEGFQPPPLSYQDRTPIRLAVVEVGLESRFEPPAGPTHIEASLPLTPEVATLALLRQRLQAAGTAGGMLAVVEDASVVEETVGPFGGPDATSDPSAQRRLRGRVKVRLVEVDDAGRETAAVTTAVTRTMSVPKEATGARRQAIAYALVRDLVDDLDRSLIENIYQSFVVLPNSARPQPVVPEGGGPQRPADRS